MNKLLMALILLAAAHHIHSQEGKQLLAADNRPSHTVVEVPLSILNSDAHQRAADEESQLLRTRAMSAEFEARISPVELELVKQAVESELRWFETLHASYFMNPAIIKTHAEMIRDKRQVIQTLFDAFASKIRQEQDKQDCVGCLAAPCNCADEHLGMPSRESGYCCVRMSLYATLSPLLFGLLYGAINLPYKYELADAAGHYRDYRLPGLYLNTRGDCIKNSSLTDQPFNVTQLTQEYGDYYPHLLTECGKVADEACQKAALEYNHKVYPRKLQAAWLPLEIIGAITVSAVILGQIAACKYRAWKRSTQETIGATRVACYRIDELVKQIEDAEDARNHRMGQEELQQVDA